MVKKAILCVAVLVGMTCLGVSSAEAHRYRGGYGGYGYTHGYHVRGVPGPAYYAGPRYHHRAAYYGAPVYHGPVGYHPGFWAPAPRSAVSLWFGF